MFAIRYLAVLALAVWLSALLPHAFVDIFAQPDRVAYACAGFTLAFLLLIKLVEGSAMRGFSLQVIMVTLTLVPALDTELLGRLGISAMTGLGVNIVICLLLLAWHIPE